MSALLVVEVRRKSPARKRARSGGAAEPKGTFRQILSTSVQPFRAPSGRGSGAAILQIPFDKIDIFGPETLRNPENSDIKFSACCAGRPLTLPR
jgi:hypothetical protein